MLKTPELYHILSDQHRQRWQQDIINSPATMFQLRAHDLCIEEKIIWAKKIAPWVKKKNGTLLINTTLENWQKHQSKLEPFCQGIHLTQKSLATIGCAPRTEKPQPLLIAASCHDDFSIQMANQANINFITLSPVTTTQSHPEVQPLGWEKFQLLAKKSNQPIYALGGLHQSDLQEAQNNGAHGIAAISSFIAK